MKLRIFWCVAVIAAVSSVQAQLSFSFSDLGTLGGTNSYAHSINASGQIVGESNITDSSLSHAVVWNSGTPTDLGTLGGAGTESAAFAVNATGIVGGSATVSGTTEIHATRWTSGAAADLGTLNGEAAVYGINASGIAVGRIRGNTNNSTAMYWTSSSNTAHPLTGLGGTIGNAGLSISDSGVVVGQAYSPATSSMRAVIWSTVSSAPVNLGTLGGTSSAANNINASGSIVGEADTSGNTQRHAILWTSNGAGGFNSTDLGLLGGTGTQSSAYGINSSGKIVGFSEVASDDEHAFIFDGGVMYDLNSFVSGASGWTLRGAESINDAGQIVGYASNNVSGAEHAFLLTPTAIPEPATFVMFVGLGALGFAACRRRAQQV